VCGDLPDLPASAYHCATQDHSLRQLRAGDLRGILVEASGGELSLAQAPLGLVMTSCPSHRAAVLTPGDVPGH
jgi:hypothetical protein